MGDEKEHWQVVNSGGTSTSNTALQIWQGAVSYFQWCDDHPIIVKKTLTSGKTQGTTVDVALRRPYTIEGMCLHCGTSKRYINDILNSSTKDSEYYIVVEKIMMIIYTQILEGALTDSFNPIMASKVLNLDKGDNKDDDRPVRIEITESKSSELSNSESQVLEKLDLEKKQMLINKTENL